MDFTPQTVATRLLLPFYFTRRATETVIAKLLEHTIDGEPLWEKCHAGDLPTAYYQDETHQAVLASLFGPTAEASRCLRLRQAARSLLFPRRLTLTSADREWRVPLKIAISTGVELFLSPFGVGVLSILVELDTERLVATPLTAGTVLAFNYRLSRRQKWNASRIELEHPQDDPNRWSKIASEDRAKIAERPTTDAAFAERLVAPGGTYTMTELSDFLLEPLAVHGELRVQQAQFSIYTVVRFGEDVHFGSSRCRDDLARLLAGLSQVEEPAHAGAVPNDLPIENALLNQHHWAGVSCLGAVHLVSDQAGDVAFNNERVPRTRDKYFLPYLAAYMQRLTIRRAGDEVGAAVRDAPARPFLGSGETYRNVLQDACEFAAVDFLPEVSTREAVNRYYRLSQAGLQVATAWSLVSQSIANLDAGCRAVQAQQHAKDMAHTLEESKELHGKVEWVEVFIVAVYAAELVHTVGEGLGFNHTFVGLATLISSLAAMFGAHHVLNPGEHVKLTRLTWKVCTTAVVALLTYLLVGAVLPSEHSSRSADHAPTTPHSDVHDEQPHGNAHPESKTSGDLPSADAASERRDT